MVWVAVQSFVSGSPFIPLGADGVLVTKVVFLGYSLESLPKALDPPGKTFRGPRQQTVPRRRPKPDQPFVLVLSAANVEDLTESSQSRFDSQGLWEDKDTQGVSNAQRAPRCVGRM